MPTPSDPTPGNNPRQFSSDVNGNPQSLLNSVKGQIGQHAELLDIYGYTQPIATLGSHPWLRDECATPGQDEPGQAVPTGNIGFPAFKGGKGK